MCYYRSDHAGAIKAALAALLLEPEQSRSYTRSVCFSTLGIATFFEAHDRHKALGYLKAAVENADATEIKWIALWRLAISYLLRF